MPTLPSSRIPERYCCRWLILAASACAPTLTSRTSGVLAVGQAIQIKWDAKPGAVWRGHIVRTPVTVMEYTTRNVGETMIAIDSGDDELLPETNVTVTVTTASEPNTLSIPRDALYSENGKAYVFRVAKGELVRTPVITGVLNLTQAFPFWPA